MLLQFVALLVKRHHKFLGLCDARRPLFDATGADDAAERGGGGGALRGSGRSAIHLDGGGGRRRVAADPGGEHGGGGGVRAARDVLGDLERVRHVLRPCEAKLKRRRDVRRGGAWAPRFSEFRPVFFSLQVQRRARHQREVPGRGRYA